MLTPPAPCPSHAISAASVSGVLIEGLRIESSGGDGIDLSTSVRDITIRSVVSSDNYEFMRAEAMASTGQLGNMLEESQLGLAAGAHGRLQHCALPTALRS
eukprot:COSAG04_NODE_326_length_16774_cov_39.129115_6_plen_101_part_00